MGSSDSGKLGTVLVDGAVTFCCYAHGAQSNCYPCGGSDGASCSFPRRERPPAFAQLPVTTTASLWSAGDTSPGSICGDDDSCWLADVNADGRADAVAFVKSTRSGTNEGDVWVAPSTGAGFGPAAKWSDWMCVGGQTCALADVNGDGKADAVALTAGDVKVALSTGTGFASGTTWTGSLCGGGRTCALADVNGDAKADVVAFVKSSSAGDAQGDVWVALSTGTGFAPATKWSDWMCIDGESCALADVNGDGFADAVAFVRSTRLGADEGDVWVALSTGSGFAPATKWSDWMCIQGETCVLADVNGDGYAGAVAFVNFDLGIQPSGDHYCN